MPEIVEAVFSGNTGLDCVWFRNQDNNYHWKLKSFNAKTILVKNFTVLSKSLKPLPLPKTDNDGNIYDEFTDSELRYRQRYVDLIVNSEIKDTFLKRTKIIKKTLEKDTFINRYFINCLNSENYYMINENRSFVILLKEGK